ncbi:MAG TPA: TonB family protein [Terriglobales bacterium]|nr:TonB family protein [Terriglobales bacterium]
MPIIIRIDRPLGYGLDEEAIKAVQKWKFVPATNNGVPVAVAVNLEVTFHYPDPPP